MFEAEAAKIKQALGESCIAVHHVGSTAVPKLASKPKIDMIIEVLRWEWVKAQLEKMGYVYKGEPSH